MDTSSFLPRTKRHDGAPAGALPLPQRRWSRIMLFFGLILLAQSTLAYLFSWVAPPQQACLVPIVITDYQARPLAALVRTGAPSFVSSGAEVSGSRLPLQDSPLFAETVSGGTTRQAILQTLDSLTKRSSQEPVVLYLSMLVMQADDGDVYLLPSDATPEDSWTWLRLRDVLIKLKACPAAQKLLVLDFMPPVMSARVGGLYSNVAAAIPRELKTVPDAERCVLCSCSPGQSAQIAEERGQSVFAYYFQLGLRGQADGWDGLRDGHITIQELSAFVRQRVERWSWRNRGQQQTPMLFGVGIETSIGAVDASAVMEPAAPPALREYPGWLLDAWKTRDAAYQSGHHLIAPRLFQKQQAMLHATENAWRAGASEAHVQKVWLSECERLQEALTQTAKEAVPSVPREEPLPDAAKKAFDELWRNLQQQIASAKPTEVEQVKTRLIDEIREKIAPTELDALVFAHALTEPHLDPGTLRLYDRLLHPTPQTVPRTGPTLRLRQLADLAMRVEVFAWPREVIGLLLRCTDLAEKAVKQTPTLPNYLALLEVPTQNRHSGEIRLWTPGFTSQDEAKLRLTTACDQFDRLLRLNEQWRRDDQLLKEALAELPGYVAAQEAMPSWNAAWNQAVHSTQQLADTLQAPIQEQETAKSSWLAEVEKRAAQLKTAEPIARALRQELQALRAPFAKEELAKLDRHCRSPHADAATLKTVEAMLSMYGPRLRAEDRAALWQARAVLALRLHEETVALDHQPNDAKRPLTLPEMTGAALEEEGRQAVWRGQTQLTLLELAGVAEERLRPLQLGLQRCKKAPTRIAEWSELGMMFQRVLSADMPQLVRQETNWPRRERLAGLLPPLDRFAGIDDAEPSAVVQHVRDEKKRQERWLLEQNHYFCRDYQGLNLENPGIQAARNFFGQTLSKDATPFQEEAYVRLKSLGSLDPLTEKIPYTNGWLELTRVVPPGKFGPAELRLIRADDVWLELAPESATVSALRSSGEPRTLVHKVPFKVTRKPMAERSGLPSPLGFLAEARFEGRIYHHLVMTQIPLDSRAVQILVSADSKEPDTTLNEIRLRPGKTRLPHYIYVKNLTNLSRKVHIEIAAGETALYSSRQPMKLDPDGVHKVVFEDASVPQMAELRGPLQVQVLDQQREKVLATRSLRVDIMPPHEYVQVAEVAYEPGGAANNKWAAQVQSSKTVAGPAIAADLILPMRRIPGLVGVGGGTLHVELPTLTRTPRYLCAEKIGLANDSEQEGPVYLNIDGVPRAFVFRTTFSRAGEPRHPQKDNRPAVRLVAPPSIMAGIQFFVDVEVDNAPRGAKLEVALGRIFDDGDFKTEIMREFADGKKQRIAVETVKDALVFEASIQDWIATFDTRSIVGTRDLRARLLDGAGKVIAQTNQQVVIDDTPPVARIMPPPVQVKRGGMIQVQAQALDAESGIAEVFFFLGAPNKGEIPVGATRLKAISANLNFTLWATSLQVPLDQKSPLAVSVYVVNRAGMASIDTASIEVIDQEPGKTGQGHIRGKVVEGARPQPNLLVTLTDASGKEIASTRTLPDGSFVFSPLPPGRYRLHCVKPESQRRATQDVIVEPDRSSKAELSLSL